MITLGNVFVIREKFLKEYAEAKPRELKRDNP
jgi:hypothetical protein